MFHAYVNVTHRPPPCNPTACSVCLILITSLPIVYCLFWCLTSHVHFEFRAAAHHCTRDRLPEQYNIHKQALKEHEVSHISGTRCVGAVLSRPALVCPLTHCRCASVVKFGLHHVHPRHIVIFGTG